MKNQIGDKDKLADKLDPEDKTTIEEAVKEALDWMDDNQSAEKQEYEDKLKEVEGICNPIISKVYDKSGGGGSSDDDEDIDRDEL